MTIDKIINLLYTIPQNYNQNKLPEIVEKINLIMNSTLSTNFDIRNSSELESIKTKLSKVSYEVQDEILDKIDNVLSKLDEPITKRRENNNSKGESPFGNLLKDILIKIFRELPQNDLISTSLVNKRMATIIQDPIIMIPLLEKYLNDLDFSTLSRLINQYKQHIKTLDLKIDKRFANCSEAIKLISICPNLVTLKLCVENKYPTIKKLVKEHENEIHLNQFENLSLIFSKLNSADIRSLGSLEKLEKLTFEALRFELKDNQFDKLFMKLRSLELLDCEMNDDELTSIVGVMTNLRSLKISDTPEFHDKQLSDDGFLHLASSMHKLESLILKGGFELSGKCLQTLIQSNPKLTHLDLIDLGMSDEDASNTWLESIRPFPKLTSLSIAIEDNTLRKIAPFLDNIQFLNLTNSLVSTKGLEALAPYTANLHTLILNTCENIDNDALNVLAPNLKNLKELDLSKCPNSIDIGLKNCITHAPLLTNLNLFMIGVDDLMAITPYLGNIKTLNLAVIEIEDEHLNIMSPYLSNIESLTLSSLSLSNKSHKTLCSLKKLKELYLYNTSMSFCDPSDLSSDWFSYIKNLTTLSLDNCLEVTDDCLKNISPFISKLEVLDLSNTNVAIEGLEKILPKAIALKSLIVENMLLITYQDLINIAPYFKKYKISFTKEKRQFNTPFNFEDLLNIAPLFEYLNEFQFDNSNLTEDQMIQIAPFLRDIPNIYLASFPNSEEFYELMFPFDGGRIL